MDPRVLESYTFFEQSSGPYCVVSYVVNTVNTGFTHTHTHTHTNSTGTDRVYHANRIILLRDPVPTFHVNRNRLIRARDMVSDLVRSSNTGKSRRCIVLIRRTNAAARQWSNIEDVAFALRKRYGNDQVRVMDFEKYSVSEQIRICRDETSILVGIHGAGLSNLIWCCPSESRGVVEILPSRPLFFRYLFWHLASSCHVPYVNVFVHEARWSSKSLNPSISAVLDAVNMLMLRSTCHY